MMNIFLDRECLPAHEVAAGGLGCLTREDLREAAEEARFGGGRTKPIG
jgi:hypothetical protein